MELYGTSTPVANLTYSLNALMDELQPGTCLLMHDYIGKFATNGKGGHPE